MEQNQVLKYVFFLKYQGLIIHREKFYKIIQINDDSQVKKSVFGMILNQSEIIIIVIILRF